jgi:branched-chain amino acid transport system substrate-binding protein
MRAIALGAGLVVSGLLGACFASNEGRGAPRPRGEIAFGAPVGKLCTDQLG